MGYKLCTRGLAAIALTAALLILVIGEPATALAEPAANRWSALGSGVNDYVNALAIRASDLYAGGGFTKAGSMGTRHIGEWSTTSKSWSKCGTGVTDDVIVMASKGRKIYVGGSFAGGLKTWNTATEKWKNVGGGVQGAVFTLAFNGTDLYVGGDFDMVGGSITAHNIAKYNISTKTWSSLGSGVDGSVWALAVYNGAVYAGGEFEDEYGGDPLNYIAAWDGVSWSPLGGGTNGPVYTIAPFMSVLFVGGSFTQAGGLDSHYMATWHAAPPPGQVPYWEKSYGFSGGTSPFGTFVFVIKIVGDDMYVAGSFANVVGAIPANNIVRQNLANHTWTALGSGVNDTVWALAYRASEKALYVGGEFTNAGGKSARHVARWRVQ